ncbi:MAG: hypothetical protein HYU67_00680 [Flavobacteriia bacterium]|nr:hypothetical protein [Flavobacteriia bacterium]
MKNYLKVFLMMMVAGLISCGETSKEKDKKETKLEDDKIENTGISFNIPSPSEQFEIISYLDGIKDLSLINDPKRRYEGSLKQSLNFGAYIADVAYLTCFDETSKYLQYFNQLEKVGKDLGISEVFTSEMTSLIKDYSNSPDSLFKLSNDTYTKSFQKLIDIEKGAELSLMLAGGWLETMHLIIGTSKGFGLSPKIDKILVDQKIVAENLIDFMIDYQDDKDVLNYMTKMGKILDLYQELDCVVENTNVNEKDGKIMISGGETCTMNKKTYNKLKELIKTYRTEVVE